MPAMKYRPREQSEPCPSCGHCFVCVACELDILYVKRMVADNRPWAPRPVAPLFDSERERLIRIHNNSLRKPKK